MDPKRLVTSSKYLSKHLRHEPHRLGLELAPGGWVEVADLLRACNDAGFALSRTELEEVVAKSNKQRFAFDDQKKLIRANGFSFFCSTNGVWLVDTVPPRYLRLLPE